MKYVPWMLSACLALIPAAAQASDWNVSAKLVMVEPTWVPGTITFAIDTAAGSCAAGSLLQYLPHGANDSEKQANMQAVFATLLTAQARNASLALYGNNSGCVVTNLWIFS